MTDDMYSIIEFWPNEPLGLRKNIYRSGVFARKRGVGVILPKEDCAMYFESIIFIFVIQILLGAKFFAYRNGRKHRIRVYRLYHSDGTFFFP